MNVRGHGSTEGRRVHMAVVSGHLVLQEAKHPDRTLMSRMKDLGDCDGTGQGSQVFMRCVASLWEGEGQKANPSPNCAKNG